MDQNDEFKLIEMLDRIIQRHTSHIQEIHNAGLPIDERMWIGHARNAAIEELEELLVEQLRHAHQARCKDQP